MLQRDVLFLIRKTKIRNTATASTPETTRINTTLSIYFLLRFESANRQGPHRSWDGPKCQSTVPKLFIIVSTAGAMVTTKMLGIMKRTSGKTSLMVVFAAFSSAN